MLGRSKMLSYIPRHEITASPPFRVEAARRRASSELIPSDALTRFTRVTRLLPSPLEEEVVVQ
jgi:hypothetical protein